MNTITRSTWRYTRVSFWYILTSYTKIMAHLHPNNKWQHYYFKVSRKQCSKWNKNTFYKSDHVKSTPKNHFSLSCFLFSFFFFFVFSFSSNVITYYQQTINTSIYFLISDGIKTQTHPKWSQFPTIPHFATKGGSSRDCAEIFPYHRQKDLLFKS